jgi:hypothetical protein
MTRFHLFHTSAPPPPGLAPTASLSGETPPGHESLPAQRVSACHREPGNLQSSSGSTPTEPPDKAGALGSGSNQAPAVPFLHPGCTRADSRLACQIAWSHNIDGRFRSIDLVIAANAAFDRGDTARAFLYLRHVLAAKRRGAML